MTTREQLVETIRRVIEDEWTYASTADGVVDAILPLLAEDLTQVGWLEEESGIRRLIEDPGFAFDPPQDDASTPPEERTWASPSWEPVFRVSGVLAEQLGTHSGESGDDE